VLTALQRPKWWKEATLSFPSSQPPVPVVVERFAAGRPARAVWVNELGGVTFRVGSSDSGVEFIKVADVETADFDAEARRLRWAIRYVTVPQVLGVGRAGKCAWLRTTGLRGESAVHPRWLAKPQMAVRAIGTGLRTLHDRLPVGSCPFDWSAGARLRLLTAAQRERLGEPPPVDRLVVCHGDACAPNTLIDDDGRCCGHVDLVGLGVADRWADLAVATLSLGWNYSGRLWDEELLAAYGVEPDPPRLDYYRRLWQAEDDTSG
jgi:kanamycin kinase